MSLIAFDALPAWARLLSVTANLLVGVGLGTIHFGGLWRAADLIASERSGLRIISILIGRWLLLGAGLIVAGLQGGGPLIAMALGVFVARYVITRRAKGAGS